jgi:glycerol-3-phosphate cytidylyltransferase
MIIGFTVGVWDLWHEGHNNVLSQAKKHCDYLIVGIMTDYWARVQKGHDRPWNSLAKRMSDLRKCKHVNKLVILDTLDMTPYLQMIDVWIKGEDQKNMRPETWPNEIYIPRTPCVSTTEIGEKIRKPGQPHEEDF